MAISNTSKSEFKGTEAKLLANRYNIEPYMIVYEDRSYTVPSSSKTTLKIKKITTKDIKWFIDQMYYYHYGTFKFNINNIHIEFKCDTDMQEYTKFEFIKFYGEHNYLIHWNLAPLCEQDISEWRYDTNLINYTKKQFIQFYGFNNYLIHWNNAPRYLDTDLDTDTDLDY